MELATPTVAGKGPGSAALRAHPLSATHSATKKVEGYGRINLSFKTAMAPGNDFAHRSTIERLLVRPESTKSNPKVDLVPWDLWPVTPGHRSSGSDRRAPSRAAHLLHWPHGSVNSTDMALTTVDRLRFSHSPRCQPITSSRSSSCRNSGAMATRSGVCAPQWPAAPMFGVYDASQKQRIAPGTPRCSLHTPTVARSDLHNAEPLLVH